MQGVRYEPLPLRREIDRTRKYEPAINTKKTEVMFQPAPGNAYIAPNVSVDGVPVKEFCYLGSMLANDDLIDKEVAK